MGVPFLTIVDKFNLIDRVDGVLAGLFNIRRGGVVELKVSRYGSISGNDCAHILRQYHVPVRGRRVTSDHFIFSVRKQQARWAEYILRRAGASLDGKPVDQRNVRWAAGKHGLPAAWDKKRKER